MQNAHIVLTLRYNGSKIKCSLIRLEDSKKFVLPLGDLKATDENSKPISLLMIM